MRPRRPYLVHRSRGRNHATSSGQLNIQRTTALFLCTCQAQAAPSGSHACDSWSVLPPSQAGAASMHRVGCYMASSTLTGKPVSTIFLRLMRSGSLLRSVPAVSKASALAVVNLTNTIGESDLANECFRYSITPNTASVALLPGPYL